MSDYFEDFPHFPRVPRYPNDSDYQTNATSYYDDLARLRGLLVELAKRVWNYDKTLNQKIEEVDRILKEVLHVINEGFNEEIYKLLVQWVEDGTLDHIINETLMNKKADITYVDDLYAELLGLINKLSNSTEKEIEDLNQLTDFLSDQIKLMLYDLNEFKEQTNQKFKKIDDLLSITDFNVDPTGSKDSLSGFKQAINQMEENDTLVLEKNATYFLSDMLELEGKGKYNIDGNGATIITDINNPSDFEKSRALNFKGLFKETLSLVGGLSKGISKIKVSNTRNLKKGDLLYFKSDEQMNGARSYYKKGGVFTVGKILNNTDILLNGSFPYNIADTVLTTIEVYDPITVHIKDLEIKGNNQTPAGYVGLAIENSVNSRIENVKADNFNHCFHVRKHVNTVAEFLESGDSLYENASESYGFASYIGTNLYLKNSVFASGRHALEISGFENSFKTTIDNVTAKAEGDTISFNLHQSSYDLVIKNSTFDSFGLAGHVVMENCLIGSGQSNIKTGNRYRDTSYVFRDCEFAGGTIRITDDAQVQPNNASYVGVVKFENCEVLTRLQLDLFTSYHVIRTDRLIVRDTHDINVRVLNNCVINSFYMDNCTIEHKENFINSIGGRINEMTIQNTRLLERYNLFNMDRFDKITLDNCLIIDNEESSGGVFRVESKNSSGTPIGTVNILNTDFRLLPISTGGFEYLNIVNSRVAFGSGRSNITYIQEATMTNIK